MNLGSWASGLVSTPFSAVKGGRQIPPQQTLNKPSGPSSGLGSQEHAYQRTRHSAHLQPQHWEVKACVGYKVKTVSNRPNYKHLGCLLYH